MNGESCFTPLIHSHTHTHTQYDIRVCVRHKFRGLFGAKSNRFFTFLLFQITMADINVDDQVECPLCMEPLEVDDLTFFPCSCGYQICRFCWHRIRTDENELCPACRKAYSENPADFKPLSQEQIAALKAEKRQRDQQKKQKVNEDRKHLVNVRVVQKNLVFVVGLPPRLADPEVLKRHEYFGKYGKIHKVVINPSTAYAGAQVSVEFCIQNNRYTTLAIKSINLP